MRGMIRKFESDIKDLQFSLEHAFRELYLHEKLSGSNFNQYKTLIYSLIVNGQPIEIIDGNTLSFITNDLGNLARAQERVLVVSVIGPQSSGKSLLLNYLFGTQFLSASGRCTKGIYGTLIDIVANPSQQSRYDKILIIDSEGIQSAEERGEEMSDFDKRIVLYLLCVSHVVLICNKGEINQNMSELIKLAVDANSDINQGQIKQPQINIIMNMLAETDEQALFKTIQKISDQVSDIELEKNQGKSNKVQLLTISKDNVFMLPFAFT